MIYALDPRDPRVRLALFLEMTARMNHQKFIHQAKKAEEAKKQAIKKNLQMNGCTFYNTPSQRIGSQHKVHGTKDTYTYDKSNLIGKSCFEVYRGESSTGELVAIKKVNTYSLTNSLKVTMAPLNLTYGNFIENEIKMLVKLSNNKYIVKIIDYYVNASDPSGYIVMELCDRSLADVSRKGPLAERYVVKYLLQILKGLAEIHKENAIHRDLKPANILLKNGKCKIADFGLVTSTHNANERAGTIPYLAPEVRYGKGNYNQKVDIYGVGLIAKELRSGNRPNMEGKVSIDWSESSGTFKNLIDWMTRYEPSNRPTAKEVISEIERRYHSY